MIALKGDTLSWQGMIRQEPISVIDGIDKYSNINHCSWWTIVVLTPHLRKPGSGSCPYSVAKVVLTRDAIIVSSVVK
jgi:hypothetical protein